MILVISGGIKQIKRDPKEVESDLNKPNVWRQFVPGDTVEIFGHNMKIGPIEDVELLRLFVKYGEHLSGCGKRNKVSRLDVCSCGFDEAVNSENHRIACVSCSHKLDAVCHKDCPHYPAKLEREG